MILIFILQMLQRFLGLPENLLAPRQQLPQVGERPARMPRGHLGGPPAVPVVDADQPRFGQGLVDPRVVLP